MNLDLGGVYLAIVLGTIIGIIIGVNLFKVRDQIVKYKSEQLDRDLPVVDKFSPLFKFLFIALHVLLYLAAFILMPTGKAMFAALFITLSALFTLVDISIRIIPNEMVLLLLLSGIIYNIINNGMGFIKSSLLGLVLVILLFGLTSLIIYFMKGTIGVGAGDLKLAMVVGMTLGYPDIIYFLLGMAAAMLGYLGLKYYSRKIVLGQSIMGTSFPMAVQITIGFIVALFFPYIEHLI